MTTPLNPSNDPPNTTTTAKQFEAEVGHLLRLTGRSVQGKTTIGYKNVDLYYEERRLTKTWRVAVECKWYTSPLSLDDTANILAHYRPLYDSNLIDEILIVTVVGLSPKAQRLVDDTRCVTHITRSELQSSAMDFTSYLDSLVRQYSEDGLAKYYTQAAASDGNSITDTVEQWLADDTNQPIAILAGYGMGQTSFSRHMAHKLASRALLDHAARIPIVIQLGDISSEQSLDGLLGRTLTSKSLVGRFSYDAFLYLNQSGRFTIFLDGFDEMKFGMTWEVFRYNMRQLNRLVHPSSKVVLLGRPSAFMSESERQYILHGFRQVGDQQIREWDWPDYREIELAPFDTDQIDFFLVHYLAYRHEHGMTDDAVATAQATLKSATVPRARQHLSDLAQRPVQLKMLAEVLPQWGQPISDLTVADLYSYFIDIVIDREMEKLTRREIPAQARRLFASELAWWLWTVKRTASFRADEVPDDLVVKCAPDFADIDDARRELLAACFVDQKLGDAFYFPHRSFQEFLVMEKLRSAMKDKSISVRQAETILNDDLAYFMAGTIAPEDLEIWDESLEGYRSLVPLHLVSVYVSKPANVEFVLSKIADFRSSAVLYPYIVTMGIEAGILDKDYIQRFGEALLQRLTSPQFSRTLNRTEYALTCIASLARLVELYPSDVPEGLPNWILRAIESLIEYQADESVDSPRWRPTQRTIDLVCAVDVFDGGDFGPAGVHLRTMLGLAFKVLGRYCIPKSWRDDAISGKGFGTVFSSPDATFMRGMQTIKRFQQVYRASVSRVDR